VRGTVGAGANPVAVAKLGSRGFHLVHRVESTDTQQPDAVHTALAPWLPVIQDDQAVLDARSSQVRLTGGTAQVVGIGGIDGFHVNAGGVKPDRAAGNHRQVKGMGCGSRVRQSRQRDDARGMGGRLQKGSDGGRNQDGCKQDCNCNQ